MSIRDHRTIVLALTALPIAFLFEHTEPPVWIGAMAIAGWVTLLLLPRRFELVGRWSVSVFALVCICVVHQYRTPADHRITTILGESEVDALLVGTVEDGPRFMPGGARFEISVHSFDSLTFERAARLTVFAPDASSAAIVPGDIVELFATVERFRPVEFPDRRSIRSTMEGRGFAARARLRDIPVVVDRSKRPDLVVRRWLARHRLDFEDRLTAAVEGERRALALGLLVGNRSWIGPAVAVPFVDTGTAHLLAISGLHFGVLAAMIWFFAGMVVNRFPSLLERYGRRRLCGGAVFVALTGYVVWTGAPTSAVRAWVAASTVIVAILWMRHFSSLHALALAVLVFVAWQPSSVTEVGFQLSFGATAGILLFLHVRSPRHEDIDRRDDRLLRGRGASRMLRAIRAIREYCGFSTAATISTWPILLHHFGTISPVALIANPLVVPIVSLALFPAMVVAALLLYVFPPVGAWLLGASAGALLSLRDALGYLATLPVANWCPGVPDLLTTFLLALCVVLILTVRSNPRLRLVVAVVAILISCALEARSRKPPEETTVHFIPVGQGDSTLVELASGEKILVDAGGVRKGRDPGREVVVPYLRRLGITELDAVIVTHADVDHIGGVFAVLDAIDVEAVVYDPLDRTPVLARLVARARNALPVQNSMVVASGVRIVRPRLETTNRNERSLVTFVETGGARVLLPGDLESAGERWLMERMDVRAAILKMPHHGSRTSSSPEFVKAVSPVLAVASAGRHSRFGHPHEIVLLRYKSRRVLPVSTHQNGLVRVTLSRDGTISVLLTR